MGVTHPGHSTLTWQHNRPLSVGTGLRWHGAVPAALVPGRPQESLCWHRHLLCCESVQTSFGTEGW